MTINIEEMVECTLKEPDDFLKIRETLTRIGVASRKDKTLYQSCHILHKQGRYFIVHFKELFALDGKPTNFSENDQARRNISSERTSELVVPLNQLKILAYKEKEEWTLTAKYNIGSKKVIDEHSEEEKGGNS